MYVVFDLGYSDGLILVEIQKLKRWFTKEVVF